jgi:hypothetical protein
MASYIKQVNALAKAWVKDDGDDTFEIDGIEFEFSFSTNSKGDRYEVWADNELIGWNDDSKDFLGIGHCVNAYLTDTE